jgi:hypothetical protein
MAVAFGTLSGLSAQSPAGVVARIEQQRTDAMRNGQDLARFYSPVYRGINARGQYETIEQIRALEASPRDARLSDVAIEVHDDTAIVTAIEGPSEADLDCVLRVWTKGKNGAWTVVAAQTTWLGTRAHAAPPAGALPNTAETFAPNGAVEEAIWTSQVALMRSFAEADPATYRMFSTEKSLRLTTSGDPITRDQWLETMAQRQKGPLAVVDEVRIAAYGSVAVVNLRGHEANPTRQSWVYLRQDGVWKLHLRYTTLVRM